jgi:hypothetical protein
MPALTLRRLSLSHLHCVRGLTLLRSTRRAVKSANPSMLPSWVAFAWMLLRCSTPTVLCDELLAWCSGAFVNFTSRAAAMFILLPGAGHNPVKFRTSPRQNDVVRAPPPLLTHIINCASSSLDSWLIGIEE